MSGTLAVVLKVLHGALMLLCFLARMKRTEIAALAGLRFDLARIHPILAGFQLADHDGTSASRCSEPHAVSPRPAPAAWATVECAAERTPRSHRSRRGSPSISRAPRAAAV